MALERLGIKLTADGAEDFKTELQGCTAALRENRDQLNLAKSAYDKNTSAVKKLTDQQKFAQAQVNVYAQKVQVLQRQLGEMEKSEETSTSALEKKRHELAQAQTQLNKYTQELNTCTTALDTNSAKLNEFGSKLESVGGKITGVGAKMTAGITVPLVAMGVASVQAASDYEENLNKIDAAFGDSAQAVKDWSETATEQCGLSKNAALEAAALYGDMATSMGLTQDAAAQMSTQLAGLAGDLASFKNISTDQAMNTLKSVFTGETESLKNLGIVMTQTNLEEFASRQNKVYSAMSESEKVTLRYQYVLAHTQNAQGDYAETADGTANSMRTFTQEVENLKIAMGEELLPAITPIIQDLTEMVKAFGDLPPGVQEAIVKFAMFAAIIGPAVTAIGGMVSGIGATAKGIASLKVALAGGTAAASAASAAAKTTASASSGAASAVVGVTTSAVAANTAIVALASGYAGHRKQVSALDEQMRQEMAIQQQVTDGIITQAQASEKLSQVKKARQEEIRKEMLDWQGLAGWISKATSAISDFFGASSQKASAKASVSGGTGVQWHADAMRDGIILDRPTIFGMQNGVLQGAGESGSEVVAGTSSLMRMIQVAVNNSSGKSDGGNTVINVYVDHLEDVQELIDMKNEAQQMSRMGAK